MSATDEDPRLVKTIDTNAHSVDWDDRIGMQSAWTNMEKGWKVEVDWRETPFGAGLFAAQDIPSGTLLREGNNGINLIQFHSIEDIETFCKGDGDSGTAAYHSKLSYVKDYMWGFNPNADGEGYDIVDDKTAGKLSAEHEAERFFGMWVPGNGLNHSPSPNTVYRPAINGGTDVGIDLVALRDIREGEELFDDYRRHGSAPAWLLKFASKNNVSLNFAECNDFVDEKDSHDNFK